MSTGTRETCENQSHVRQKQGGWERSENETQVRNLERNWKRSLTCQHLKKLVCPVAVWATGKLTQLVSIFWMGRFALGGSTSLLRVVYGCLLQKWHCLSSSCDVPIPSPLYPLHHKKNKNINVYHVANVKGHFLLSVLSHINHVWLVAILWIVALLRPWDSPGKNTGVGCHFLLHFALYSSPFWLFGKYSFSLWFVPSTVQGTRSPIMIMTEYEKSNK